MVVLFAASPVWSWRPKAAPGEIARGNGTEIVRAGRRLHAPPGENPILRDGDRVVTGGERAVLRWSDGSRAVVGPNSALIARQGKGEDAPFYLILEKGELAYSFAADASLRAGFGPDDPAVRLDDPPETDLAGYLAVGQSGERQFRRLNLASLAESAGRRLGDDVPAESTEREVTAGDANAASATNEDSIDYDSLPKHRVAYSIGATTENQVIEAITPNGDDVDVVSPEGTPLALQPRWSPDLNRVVYQRRVGGTFDIVLQDNSGVQSGETIKQITNTPLINETEPVWGDGNIYYVSDRDAVAGVGTAIFAINFDGDPESVRRLTDPALNATGPDQRVYSGLPGNSSDIVFSGYNPETGTRDLYLIAPSGDPETLRVLLATSNANETDPRWSPAGKEVSYVTDKSGAKDINAIDVKNGEIVIPALIVDASVDTSLLDFSYSPSGDQYVATYSSGGGANDTLAVLNRQGEAVRVLESANAGQAAGSSIYLHPDWRGGIIAAAWWASTPVIGTIAGVAVAGAITGIVIEVTDDGDSSGGSGDPPDPPPGGPPPPVSPFMPPPASAPAPARRHAGRAVA